MEDIWSTRVQEVFDRFGIDTDEYGSDPELMDNISRYLGFRDRNDLERFPTSRKIINRIALPLEPQDVSRQYDLVVNTVNLIKHEWNLFKNENRTVEQLSNLIRYANDNFKDEINAMMIVMISTQFRNDDETPYDFVDIENPYIDLISYKNLYEKYRNLTDQC